MIIKKTLLSLCLFEIKRKIFSFGFFTPRCILSDFSSEYQDKMLLLLMVNIPWLRTMGLPKRFILGKSKSLQEVGKKSTVNYGCLITKCTHDADLDLSLLC
jgi:hypothetical protein